MHPLQLLVNRLNAQAQSQRSTTQLTLGGLIERLGQFPPDKPVATIASPHSYRGYYCDLAFESGPGQIPASSALEIAKGALGEVFQGYKGGDFFMYADTPVWLAEYGDCGMRIMAIGDDGELELAEDS